MPISQMNSAAILLKSVSHSIMDFTVA